MVPAKPPRKRVPYACCDVRGESWNFPSRILKWLHILSSDDSIKISTEAIYPVHDSSRASRILCDYNHIAKLLPVTLTMALHLLYVHFQWSHVLLLRVQCQRAHFKQSHNIMPGTRAIQAPVPKAQAG